MNFVKDPGSVDALADVLALGELSPSDLVQRCLDRIDAVEERIAGWCQVDAAGAQAQAAALSASAGRRPPLWGIPVSVKDVIDVAGFPTRAGSKVRQDIAPASADAELVAALRTAGAIILGKSHTTEFAYFDGPPPTRNPHDLRCTPGGSSAGPAAVVASGMVPAALGTQTAGSVSRPAAYCGIGAFKPSTGSWSGVGLVPFSPRFDTIGVFGYRVEDAVVVYRALAPAYLADRAAPAPGFVLRLEDPILDAAEPSVRASLDEAAARLKAHGLEVRTQAAPVSFAAITALHKTIIEYEVARAHGGLLQGSAALLTEGVRAAFERGLTIDDAAYLDARRRIAGLVAQFWAAMPDDAVLLFPAAPGPAPQGMATGDPRFIIPFTALGGPIASLPVGFAPGGLPLGIMLCAAPGRDLALAGFAVDVAPAVEVPR